MSRLKNLYTRLIEHRFAAVNPWVLEYRCFIDEVVKVRAALEGGKHLRDPETYGGTIFATGDLAARWPTFARKLLFEKSNGVASRGQSVLREEDFGRFLVDESFVAALEAMVRNPDRTRYAEFAKVWDAALPPGSRRSPLLVRRTLAACTTEVSSTVNEWDFNQVYDWLEGQELLDSPAADEPADGWYGRNLRVMRTLRGAFAGEPPESRPDDVLLSIFVWQLVEDRANPFTLRKQVIKYGAPGTGKTFSARQAAELVFRLWRDRVEKFGPVPDLEKCSETVQFHPSYGYEDFMEGLRPGTADNGDTALRLRNGNFKEFCRRAGRWDVDVWNIPEVGQELAQAWETLTVEQLRPHFDQHLSHEHWAAIRAMDVGAMVAGAVPPFFFLIDEINRAELSRVFGELMFCLEYRGVQGRITTQYAELNTPDTAMIQEGGSAKFFIPHNVHIIGTMNTIDRSVESFDLALRRRFRWERVEPDYAALRYHLAQADAAAGRAAPGWTGLTDQLWTLNQRIRETAGLGRDYEIGHAYLMNLRYPRDLTVADVRERVWEDALAPLLGEYLRGTEGGDEQLRLFAKGFGVA